MLGFARESLAAFDRTQYGLNFNKQFSTGGKARLAI
jgi:hypothetical protein